MQPSNIKVTGCGDHERCTVYVRGSVASFSKKLLKYHVRTLHQSNLTRCIIVTEIHAGEELDTYRPAIPLLPGACYIRRQCPEFHAKFGMWLPGYFFPENDPTRFN